MANGYDFGLPMGLAYQHDFQQDIQNRAMLHQLRRQKEIDQKAEAQLWAKELETMAVQNPYDSAGLEKFLDGHYKKMGKWLQEHPNFRSDPEEYVYWSKNFVRPIKDNEFVKRDLSFQQQKELYSQHVAKYGEGHWKTKKMGEEMRNYRSMGNIDGDPNGGIKEFMFAAPYDGFDPLETISTYFGKLRPSGDAKPELKGGMWFYNASYDEKKALASQLVSDPNFGGMWEEWWGNMDDSQRRGDNMIDHIIEVGSPFVTPKTRTPQRPYASGSGRGKGEESEYTPYFVSDVKGPLEDDFLEGQNFPIKQANPGRMNSYLQDEQGKIAISGNSWFGVPNKEEGITRLPGFFTNQKRMGSSTGNVTVVNENGMKLWLTEVEMPITIDEAIEMEPIVQKNWNREGLLSPGQKEEYFIDRSTWGGNLDVFSGVDEPDDFEFGSAYTSVFSKRRDPENPEKLSPDGQITMKMWVPFEPDDKYFQRSYERDVTGLPSAEHPQEAISVPEGFIPSTTNSNQAYRLIGDRWQVIEYDEQSRQWYNVSK